MYGLRQKFSLVPRLVEDTSSSREQLAVGSRATRFSLKCGEERLGNNAPFPVDQDVHSLLTSQFTEALRQQAD